MNDMKIQFVIARHFLFFFFFSSRRRHTRFDCDWSSDVCSSDLRDGLRARRSSIAKARVLEQRNLQIAPARPKRHPEIGKSTRLNSSHSQISYAVFCLKKKN